METESEHMLPKQEYETSKEEMPDCFDAVIVLGKNWRKYPKNPEENAELSLESKMSAIAAGEMLESKLTNKLIFSTGKTAGDAWPSEAEAMKDYMLRHFKNLPEDAVIMEEISIDTHENAVETLKILEEFKLKHAAILTVGFHVERSEQIFANHGIDVRGIASEDLLAWRSPHYAAFLEKFEKSARIQVEEAKEWLLRHLLRVDPKGELISKVTKKIRG